MSVATSRPEYATLLAKTLPAVIHSEKENERYTAVLEELDHKDGKLIPAEERLAELLTLLIEDFEEKHYSLKPATGIQALEELMEANGLKQKHLVDIFDTPSIISEVLSGKRKLNTEHIRKLSHRFHVSPELFSNSARLRYSVPALGRMVNSSTVLSAGRFRAFTTASATVFGDIIFFRGASGQNVFQIAVSVAPGSNAITRIPCPRSSSRSVFVNPSAPCFEALYAAEPGKTRFAAIERLFTIAAPRFISGNAARVTRNMPVRLVSMTSIQESTGNFPTPRLG